MRRRSDAGGLLALALLLGPPIADSAIKSETTNCTHAVRQGTAQISATTGCVTRPLEQQPPRGTGVSSAWTSCEAAARARTLNPTAAPIRSFTIRTGRGVVVGTAADRAQCEASAWSRLELEALTRTDGSNVNSCQALTRFSADPSAPACLSSTSFIVSFQPAVICPPAPGPIPRECPAGTIGAWAQTATVGPAPECVITWAPSVPDPADCFTLERAALLSWTPPTTNTDGSTLADLAGYRLNYGTGATEQTYTVQIADPTVTRYVLTTLWSGRWYFSAKAYTSTGGQSASSNTVSKSIP